MDNQETEMKPETKAGGFWGIGFGILFVIGGELSFYTAPDYDGIYSVYGHMGYETVSRITIQDDELFEEIVSEGEVEEDYYSNDMPISSYSTSDTSYLSEF